MTAIDQAFIKVYLLEPVSRTPAEESNGWARPAHSDSATADPDWALTAAGPPPDGAHAAESKAGGEASPADAERLGQVAGDEASWWDAVSVEVAGGGVAESERSAEADQEDQEDQEDPVGADPDPSEECPKASAEQAFRPAFQVDGLAWPSGPTRLNLVASEQVDQLADALTLRLDRGQRVVAISGCRRGDGCTTLLLCIARRLVERGLKVAVLDADFDHPLLARRLGLLPEVGWEGIITRQLPVEEVIVESIHDRLAVLPLCGPIPREHSPTDELFDPAARLNVLREHYDLVLVDLGEFRGAIASGEGVFDALADWIDAVVLVRNVRSTSQAELNRTRWRIEAAGLVEAGITENFVEARQSA